MIATKKKPVDFFMHTPAQSTSRYVKWVEDRKDAPKIDYGCILDKYIIPLHPGDFMSVLSRPGHGKTSFMAYMAKRTGNKIRERNEDNKCVVFVSWDQSIEELECFFQSGHAYSSTDLAWGRVPLDTVREQSIKRINLPIWMIGYSIEDAGERKPEMTMEIVFEAIRSIRHEYKFEPTLVCLDYLQIIPSERRMTRQDEVFAATRGAKQLGMDLGVPIIGGVQASRKSEERGGQMPTMADAQWGSIIEQTVDKKLALLKAIKVHDDGEIIPMGGHNYIVDEHTTIVKNLKQRMEKGYGIWAVHFEMDTLEMNDYTTTKLEY